MDTQRLLDRIDDLREVASSLNYVGDIEKIKSESNQYRVARVVEILDDARERLVYLKSAIQSGGE